MCYLGAGERSRFVGVSDPADQLACVDVREGPVLVGAAGQHVVPGGVETHASHGTVVNPQHVSAVPGHGVPHADRVVVRPGDDDVLPHVVDHSVHLLGVALELHHLGLSLLVEDRGVLIGPASDDLVGVLDTAAVHDDDKNIKDFKSRVNKYLLEH